MACRLQLVARTQAKPAMLAAQALHRRRCIAQRERPHCARLDAIGCSSSSNSARLAYPAAPSPLGSYSKDVKFLFRGFGKANALGDGDVHDEAGILLRNFSSTWRGMLAGASVIVGTMPRNFKLGLKPAMDAPHYVHELFQAARGEKFALERTSTSSAAVNALTVRRPRLGGQSMRMNLY